MVARDVGKNPETGAEIRERRYRLRDNYTRFFLKCVRPASETIDDGSFLFTRLSRLDEWETVKGFAFENLIVNHYAELLPYLHLEDSLIYSAAPYRKNGAKGVGYQIDLLLQTKTTAYVIEMKRREHIGEEVAREVNAKVDAVGFHPGISTRTVLVYDGKLAPSVRTDHMLDFVIPAERLFG